MSEGWLILLLAGAYLGGLFAIAYVGDRRADQGRSVINNPYIYTLSIAVYCTAWTYYGSVGRAAVDGLGFLPIYLGPTLMACLWWFVLRKMLRITKAYGITSIADFVASRYGKSALLGGLVTIVAVFGGMPYISLQLKAVSTSVAVILDYPAGTPFWSDLALFVALLLAAFSILFGTRHIDATEHHQGMVAAIAFESIVKLVAFVAVGVYVTFGLYDGFADVFDQARAAGYESLLSFRGAGLSFADWAALTSLAGMAILFLPRQFQVAVIENVNEDHLNKAIWLFPLYLLAINLFVLPIALAGRLRFPGAEADADFMVLLLPMLEHQHLLTLFTFLGGLSAATAMVIVATVALSTMLCNDLVMPVLLRLRFLRLNEQPDLSGLLLAIRRGAILAMLLLGYVYFRLVGESYALATMGLVSFCAAAQFAPPILFGIYWKAATLRGAFTGLLAGFAIWLYTLLLPALARSGWLDPGFLNGPLGLEILKPYALFGVSGLDPISHSLLWSLLANIACLVGWSLLGRQGSFERIQASLFVEVDRLGSGLRLWRGSAAVADLRALLARYVGAERAEHALARHARTRGLALAVDAQADSDLVNFAERLLAGAIGAASARVMISTVVRSADFGPDEVMAILDEASQVIEYSRELEQKSRALEIAGAELRRVNQRLTELDRLKDEFISTVSHELRTPLTSIRSFSEILLDNPDLELAQRNQFLGIVVKESERLTRLINDILDMSRIASGKMEWHLSTCDPKAVVEDALAATSGLFRAKRITVETELASGLPAITVDRDRLMQVVINLLSNAAKFVRVGDGRVRVGLAASGRELMVSVEDNGPGIPASQRNAVFERFRQLGGDVMTAKPAGSGLGLAICRQIVEHFGGRIWIEPGLPRGAIVRFSLPLATPAAISSPAVAPAPAGED
jgi:Na+/proline symporter/nitrogen-specific signal transduction histidine kinase